MFSTNLFSGLAAWLLKDIVSLCLSRLLSDRLYLSFSLVVCLHCAIPRYTIRLCFSVLVFSSVHVSVPYMSASPSPFVCPVVLVVPDYFVRLY